VRVAGRVERSRLRMVDLAATPCCAGRAGCPMRTACRSCRNTRYRHRARCCRC
jgi:hypothetical protein